MRHMLWLTGLLAASVAAQERPDLSADRVRAIDSIIQAGMTQEKIPGLSLAIGIDGMLVLATGFGMADLENRVPATSSTLFRTASIAKPMTATAAMQLVEQGRIELDAPIQRYCPAFPEKRWPVTVRHLLSHQSGVRHYQRPGEASGTEHYFDVVSTLALFKDDSLLHEPGTRYTYTTYGYSVLGCAIEGASGTPYVEYMREHVFGPAGMARTQPDDHFRLVPDRARGYTMLDADDVRSLPSPLRESVQPGMLINARLHDTSMKIPGGGLVSTAADLVRFAMALLNGTLVADSTRARMWTAYPTRAGQETGYGFGWGVGEIGGTKLVSHSGGQAGASSLLYVFPEHRVAVAIMANRDGARTGGMMRGIVTLLLPSAQASPDAS